MESSKLLLMKEYKRLRKDPPDDFSMNINESNIYEWKVYFQGPIDTLYEEGYFSAKMTFPHNYPLSPPTFCFVNKMFHPNIYTDGKVCLSILHEPVEDEMHYESINERWTPAYSIESIVISVISLLSKPNLESPANVDSSVMYRNDFNKYKKIIRKLSRNTLEK